MKVRIPWKIINYAHILAPLLLLLFPSFWQCFYQGDAARHVEYVEFLFFGAPGHHLLMEGYPPLMHAAIYTLALGQENLIIPAFGIFTVAVFILFRWAFYKLLWHQKERRKLVIMFLLFELPAVVVSLLSRVGTLNPALIQLFTYYETARQPRFIWSLEMLTVKLGLIPSYAALSLGMLAAMSPTWLIPLAIITRFLSLSGQILFTGICLIAFVKSWRWKFLLPFILFWPLNSVAISLGVLGHMQGDLRLLVTAIWAAALFFCYRSGSAS